jgi:hypothetical protein
MLAEFPSCADTEMKLNREIDRSKSKTSIRDFIDVSSKNFPIRSMMRSETTADGSDGL